MCLADFTPSAPLQLQQVHFHCHQTLLLVPSFHILLRSIEPPLPPNLTNGLSLHFWPVETTS